MSGIVLAHLIAPAAFGIFGMALTVTVFATRLQTLGLSEAVIQRSGITHDHLSNLFWFSLGVGSVLGLAVLGSAPLVASFYGHPELIPVIAVLATTFVMGGCVVVQTALMARRLQFRAMAMRSLIPKVIATAVGLALAATGGGYWALVIMQVVGVAATAVLIWLAVDWRPGRPKRGTGTLALIKFGASVSISNFLTYFSGNMDNVLIGRYLGAAPLGLYARAYNLFLTPLRQIHGPLANVAIPVLAAVVNTPKRYRTYYRRFLSGLAILGMPGIMILAVMSREIIGVLLGPRWLGAAQVFRWLAVGGFVQMVVRSFGWLFVTSGRARALAYWAMIATPITVASFAIGLHWGITGVAASLAVAQALLTPMSLRYAIKGTPVTVSDVLSAVWRPAVIAVAVGVADVVVRAALHGQPAWLVLLAGTGVGVACWVCLALIWKTVRDELKSLRGSFSLRGRRLVSATAPTSGEANGG